MSPGPASTVVAQGPVSSISALPAGVRPIAGVGAPPLWPAPSAPQAESVTPTVGGPHTTFIVLLAAAPANTPTRARSVARAHRLGRLRDLPRRQTAFDRRGRFLPGNQGVDPCLPPASQRVWPTKTIDRAGTLVFVYQVAPQQLHLRAWCPGRYQLGLQTLPNPLPPRYTTPPYTGPSGTSIYITIK